MLSPYRSFPRELDIIAATVTLGSRFAINGLAQFQVWDDRAGVQTNMSMDARDFSSANIAPPTSSFK